MIGLKVTAFFAAIGFLAGVVANFAAAPLMTFITEVLPQLLYMGWFLSGIAGTILTVGLLLTWNWAMSRRQH